LLTFYKEVKGKWKFKKVSGKWPLKGLELGQNLLTSRTQPASHSLLTLDIFVFVLKF